MECNWVSGSITGLIHFLFAFKSIFILLVKPHIFISGKRIKAGTIHEILAVRSSFLPKCDSLFLAVLLFVLMGADVLRFIGLIVVERSVLGVFCFLA